MSWKVARALAKSVALLWLAIVPIRAVSAQTTILTLQETRQAAVTAFETGAFAQAEALARALLRRDPRDLAAQIVMIEVASALADHERAADLAAYGYSLAETDVARFTLARLAAREHAMLEHGTRAQLWLRRAREASPTEAAARDVAEDYAFIRARNPLSVSVNGGVAPRSNINNGSSQSTQEVLIFGIPVTLPLSGDAQALSGIAYSLGGELTYRLDDRSDLRTTLSFAAFGETYQLSDEAKALAPTVNGADFAYLNAELALRQERRIGQNGAVLGYGASAGTTWSGGAAYYDFTRLSLTYGWQSDGGTRHRLDGQTERQTAKSGGAPRHISEIGWRGDWKTGAGDQMSAALRLSQSTSPNPNYDYDGVSASLSWAPQEPFARGHWSISGEVGARNYAPSILSPDPREDRSVSARLSYRPDSFEFYGFRPEIAVTGRRNASNVARFDTRDLGLGMRIVSSF